MNYKEELTKWSVNVSNNKKELDKEMFYYTLQAVINRLDSKVSYDEIYKWLKKNFEGGINHSMKGPVLLARNSKVVMDKLYNLKQKEIKNDKIK